MSRIDTITSAAAWDELVRELIKLGPNPPHAEVVETVVAIVWETEGITLDEDHRERAS